MGFRILLNRDWRNSSPLLPQLHKTQIHWGMRGNQFRRKHVVTNHEVHARPEPEVVIHNSHFLNISYIRCDHISKTWAMLLRHNFLSAHATVNFPIIRLYPRVPPWSKVYRFALGVANEDINCIWFHEPCFPCSGAFASSGACSKRKSNILISKNMYKRVSKQINSELRILTTSNVGINLRMAWLTSALWTSCTRKTLQR